MALADDWPGHAARSCRALVTLGTGAAPDGSSSSTESSGEASSRRHWRSSLLTKRPSLLGIAPLNVPAPCLGSRLPSSSTSSRRCSAGSALLTADPLMSRAANVHSMLRLDSRWTQTPAALPGTRGDGDLRLVARRPAAEYDRIIGSLYNSFSCGYSLYSVAWGRGLKLKLESARPGVISNAHPFKSQINRTLAEAD